MRAAAAALDYRIDRAASQLRSGKARVVAVLVPSLENPFFTSIVAGLERAANREGYDIIVASANDDAAIEAARLAALLSWRPSGVIVIPSTDAFPAGAPSRRRAFPMSWSTASPPTIGPTR